MPSEDFAAIQARVLDEIDYLAYETDYVLKVLRPHWPVETRHFGNTVHGLALICFSKIDELSQYREFHGDQTARMAAFLDDLFGVSSEASDVAVKMWRHVLVHTGQPREVKSHGARYSWLLTCVDDFPRDQHFRFQPVEPPRVLNLALHFLVEDLRVAAHRLFADFQGNPEKQRRVESVSEAMKTQAFRLRRPPSAA